MPRESGGVDENQSNCISAVCGLDSFQEQSSSRPHAD